MKHRHKLTKNIDCQHPAGTILLNQIQIKGTHNSYHKPSVWGVFYSKHAAKNKPIYQQLEISSRTLEFDIHHDISSGQWNVFHHPLWDAESTCSCLHDCLSHVKRWSDDNPGHLPLFIDLEPKYSYDFHKVCQPDGALREFRGLHTQILSVFPSEQIISPLYVQGQHPTMR